MSILIKKKACINMASVTAKTCLICNAINWHERAAFHRSVFGRSTAGNDVAATIIIRFFFRFFSLSRPFLSSHIFRHAINMFVNMV